MLLQNKLESSQEEKKRYVEKSNLMLEESENILRDAVELQTELELEPVDKIEEVLL